jgi:hypothetical protein
MRPTQVLAVLDEEGVERDPVAGGDHPLERRFGLLRAPGPNEPEPVRDPVDVRIDGDRGQPVAEDEDAPGGLRPDPREGDQLAARARDLAAVALEELPGARTDPSRLGPIEPDRPDQRLELGDRRPGERPGVRVPGEQRGRGDVRRLVAGPLGEDRADEHLERVLRVVAQVRDPPVPRPVEAREAIEDRLPIERAGRRGGQAPLPGPAGPRERRGGRAPSRPGSERSGSSPPAAPRSSSPTR